MSNEWVASNRPQGDLDLRPHRDWLALPVALYLDGAGGARPDFETLRVLFEDALRAARNASNDASVFAASGWLASTQGDDALGVLYAASALAASVRDDGLARVAADIVRRTGEALLQRSDAGGVAVAIHLARGYAAEGRRVDAARVLREAIARDPLVGWAVRASRDQALGAPCAAAHESLVAQGGPDASLHRAIASLAFGAVSEARSALDGLNEFASERTTGIAATLVNIESVAEVFEGGSPIALAPPAGDVAQRVLATLLSAALAAHESSAAEAAALVHDALGPFGVGEGDAKVIASALEAIPDGAGLRQFVADVLCGTVYELRVSLVEPRIGSHRLKSLLLAAFATMMVQNAGCAITWGGVGGGAALRLGPPVAAAQGRDAANQELDARRSGGAMGGGNAQVFGGAPRAEADATQAALDALWPAHHIWQAFQVPLTALGSPGVSTSPLPPSFRPRFAFAFTLQPRPLGYAGYRWSPRARELMDAVISANTGPQFDEAMERFVRHVREHEAIADSGDPTVLPMIDLRPPSLPRQALPIEWADFDALGLWLGRPAQGRGALPAQRGVMYSNQFRYLQAREALRRGELDAAVALVREANRSGDAVYRALAAGVRYEAARRAGIATEADERAAEGQLVAAGVATTEDFAMLRLVRAATVPAGHTRDAVIELRRLAEH